MSKFPVSENMLYVCTGSKCAKRGGKDLFKSLKTFMKYQPNASKLEIVRIECTDRCDFAPVCNLQPENIWLKEYTGKQVLRRIDQLLNEPGRD